MSTAKKRLVIGCISVVLIFVVLFFGHPWIFAIPDRIAEMRMQHNVQVGMSRTEVEATLTRTGSTFRDISDIIPNRKQSGETEILTSYLHSGTICVASEMRYYFLFDARGILRSITHKMHGSAC